MLVIGFAAVRQGCFDHDHPRLPARKVHTAQYLFFKSFDVHFQEMNIATRMAGANCGQRRHRYLMLTYRMAVGAVLFCNPGVQRGPAAAVGHVV